MLRLIKHASLIKKKLIPVESKIISRSVYDINFDSEEEIMKNIFNKVMIIGMNLPDTKNLLTETALEKLYSYIESFDNDDEISVAVLHGCSGNFCAGTVSSKEAVMLSQNVLRKLNELKKPIIASLDGYTINFGLHLAIMCDMRVMDSAAMAGFTNRTEDFECPPCVSERLLLTVGLSKALELICVRSLWSAVESLQAQFINKLVDHGCALGQSIVLAQSLSFHRPFKSVMNDRSQIYSFLKTKV